MKNFWVSFLGAFAAIWVTSILTGILSVVVMVAMMAASLGGDKSVKVHDDSILTIDLSGAVTDRVAPTDFYSVIMGEDGSSIALNELVAAINHAAEDSKIKGIMLYCNGASAGLAQSQAIINALQDFRESGKWVWAYGDSYTQGNYFIASAADSLLLNPIGMVDIHGLSSTVMYFKGLMDKIGVDAQIVKVGTYKSAVEPYMLKDMSEANREQITAFLSAIWNDISDTMAANRGLDADSLRQYATQYQFAADPESYLAKGLVDKLVYGHELEDMLTMAVGKDDYDDVNTISLEDYVSVNNLPAHGSKKKDKKKIAILYAVGEITESGDEGIASDDMVPEIMDLIDDEDLDGLILRVNSPGGSAFASEQIWEALEQFKTVTGKPFYVSMGDVAASGGYYISCGADKIYAEPLTLTGSIGIFGIIPNAQKLLNDKLGITTTTVSTSGNQSPGIFEPMSPDLAQAMQNYVNRGYELFTSRCAQGRGISQDSIKAIGEGRVWDGAKALSIGLVDEMGGLAETIAAMADTLDAADSYYIVEYPKTEFKWWEEILTQSANLRSGAIRHELGEAAAAFDAIKAIRQTPSIQCRMEYMDIH